MRILIIEDEVRVATLLADSIELQDHEAILALSGAQGLALLEQKHPDAVFLDIVMPGMSGLEVLRRIREIHQSLPVIVITGHASSDQVEEARRLGITDCIEKPLVLNQLDRTLGSLKSDKP